MGQRDIYVDIYTYTLTERLGVYVYGQRDGEYTFRDRKIESIR